MKIDDPEFLEEVVELCEDAENALINLSKGGEFSDNYNEIFRAFHSVKGAAGMLGYETLQEHMHILETHFESLKENNHLNQEEIDLFLNGIDSALKITQGEEVEDIAEIVAKSLSNDTNDAPDAASQLQKEIDASISFEQNALEENSEESNKEEEEEETKEEVPSSEEPSHEEISETPLEQDDDPIIEGQAAEENSDSLKAFFVTNKSGVKIDFGNLPVEITNYNSFESLKVATPDFIILDQTTLKLFNEMDRPDCVIMLADSELPEAEIENIDFFLNLAAPQKVIDTNLKTFFRFVLARNIVKESLKFNIYQFKDLVSYLESKNQHDMVEHMKNNIAKILSKMKSI